MAFWGVEVKSGGPFTLQCKNRKGRLHVSQATLGIGSSPKRSVLQCNVGNKAPVLLCSLLPDRLESCSLNLEFEEEEDVVFSVLGPRSIYLSGYYIGPSHTGDENDSDSYGEDIDIESETDEESSYYGSEDEYDDDFIDDDDVLEFDASPKRVNGVKIEEIIDDEQPTKDTDGPKSSKHQIRPTAERKFLTLEGSDSEDEDGLPISTGTRRKHSKTIEAKADLDNQPREEKAGEMQANDESHYSAGSKRKSDALGQDGNQNKKQDPSENEGLENSRKTKKKKEKGVKKKEVPESGVDAFTIDASENASNAQHQRGQERGCEDGEHDNTEAGNDKTAVCSAPEVEEVQKKKKKKKKRAETDQSTEAEESKLATLGNKKELEKISSLEDHAYEQPIKGARTFPNGLVIEEISMGKPDGKRASPGTKVFVHYIGKLKKNGAIFDSSVGRKPFKFRLGIGEVIKGWDVGINGMRVGDKRRLTIPPAMGYGSTGVGKIPGNAWLVFDVELVNVQ